MSPPPKKKRKYNYFNFLISTDNLLNTYSNLALKNYSQFGVAITVKEHAFNHADIKCKQQHQFLQHFGCHHQHKMIALTKRTKKFLKPILSFTLYITPLLVYILLKIW